MNLYKQYALHTFLLQGEIQNTTQGKYYNADWYCKYFFLKLMFVKFTYLYIK